MVIWACFHLLEPSEGLPVAVAEAGCMLGPPGLLGRVNHQLANAELKSCMAGLLEGLQVARADRGRRLLP